VRIPFGGATAAFVAGLGEADPFFVIPSLSRDLYPAPLGRTNVEIRRTNEWNLSRDCRPLRVLGALPFLSSRACRGTSSCGLARCTSRRQVTPESAVRGPSTAPLRGSAQDDKSQDGAVRCEIHSLSDACFR